MEILFAEGAVPGEKKEEKENSLMDEITATSRALVRAQISWSPEERKLFVMCLTKIRWTKGDNDNIVELDKREIIEALNLKISSDTQSVYIRKAFSKLAKDSEVHWTDPKDKENWEDDFIILGRKSRRGKIYVEINRKFMPLLEDLVQKKDYLMMWSSDIFKFKSRFTFALYDELRLRYDSRYTTNYRTYSTKELKDLFNLSKKDYTRKNGSFDRSNFEKYVLNVAIKEINDSKMMSILPMGHNQKGELVFFEKQKKAGSVSGYTFKYFVKTRFKDVPEGQMEIYDYIQQ